MSRVLLHGNVTKFQDNNNYHHYLFINFAGALIQGKSFKFFMTQVFTNYCFVGRLTVTIIRRMHHIYILSCLQNIIYFTDFV